MPDSPDQAGSTVLGQSAAIRRVFELVARVAETPATVLLTGESGTGKELIAREIHRTGAETGAPFVLVNCAAIPGALLEAELFGYERGAFTDAKISKMGLLELGEGGTVLLDEVGLMPLDLQAKLLSVLESRRFRRVGGTAEIDLGTRFIAASNADLDLAVQENRFRLDLLYRLNVFPIPLPPLRDRDDDALLIARHFLDTYSERYDRGSLELSPGAERWLLGYDWPGNVRELRNVVERAVLLARSQLIQTEDLAVGKEETDLAMDQRGGLSVTGIGEIHIEFPPWGIALEDVEKRLIEAALETTRGKVSRAAQLLRVSRDTLRYRIRKYGITSPHPPDQSA